MGMQLKIGDHFGHLEVLALLDERDSNGRKRYECRCDCGKEVVRVRKQLRRDGRHVSCGCHLQKRRRMVTDTTKQCKDCGEVKHVNEFQALTHPDRGHHRKYYNSRCKPCAGEHNRRRLYGNSLAELIHKQGSAICPLCKIRLADSLDHDHETGLARGALCRKCNLIMHYVDNREWLERAEKYRKGVLNASAQSETKGLSKL